MALIDCRRRLTRRGGVFRPAEPLAQPERSRYQAAMDLPRFHLAFPVRDLAEARAFYGGLLGCPEGRSSPEWVDFDFHGHQIVAHLSPGELGQGSTSPVDGHDVPVRHFGVILSPADWNALAERLKSAGTRFIIEPNVRFKGEPGEQSTMFFLDPSGNALEFKAFADDAMVFAR
jgi:extradiol dioxygenase family protein